jgi:hypothetical protein
MYKLELERTEKCSFFHEKKNLFISSWFFFIKRNSFNVPFFKKEFVPGIPSFWNSFLPNTDMYLPWPHVNIIDCGQLYSIVTCKLYSTLLSFMFVQLTSLFRKPITAYWHNTAWRWGKHTMESRRFHRVCKQSYLIIFFNNILSTLSTKNNQKI